MNSTDANRILNDAPNDSECITSFEDDDFNYIAQLTKEEKKELLELWFKRNQ